MIRKIKKLNLKISIYFKVVTGIIVFTLLIGGIERYQISQNIINQFFQAKKSKNLLLLNTISPILGLNISLGLDDANKEYLDYIVKQNSDVNYIEMKDANNKVVYSFKKANIQACDYDSEKEDIDFCNKKIFDSSSNALLATINLRFSNKDFQKLQQANISLTLKLVVITFILLSIFVVLIRREFKTLKELSNSVLSYNPKLNNFTLSPSSRGDEVGVIQNAIVYMVDKISSYTKLLDETNASLEDAIKERTKELEEANRQLKLLSVTDELTQLPNRRYFEEYFHNHLELAKRQSVSISIVLCDIDYFKKVNDTYGHQVGDEVLKVVAQTLRDSLNRSSDFVARYGGEEFIAVMYNTASSEAKMLCQRVQENLKTTQSREFKNKNINPVTMSFGISSIMPGINEDSESLIKDADSALYKAKESGRDRIIIAVK